MSDQGNDTSTGDLALGGLTLARVGEIMAHLRHYPGDASAEVLARLGLDEPRWDAALAAWMDELAEEAAREEAQLAPVFAGTFAAARARLAAEQPPLTSLGSLPGTASEGGGDDDAITAAPPTAEPVAAILIHARPTAGAALLAGHESNDASPWAADIRGTVVGGFGAERPLLPFDPSAPPSLPSRDATAHPVRALNELGGTLNAPGEVSGQVLPFAPAPAPLAYTIEQYASLCVELAAEPNGTEDVLRRYRLTPEERAQLDTYWRKRMADEPSTWMAWDRAFKAYKTWYDSARRSRVPER